MLFDHGSAYCSEDFAAAAFWLPPGVGPDEEALGAVMEKGVDGDLRGEVFALLEQIGSSHPEVPHWNLPAIGVDPRRHGMASHPLSVVTVFRSSRFRHLSSAFRCEISVPPANVMSEK